MSSGRNNINSTRAKRYRLMMEAGRSDAYIARRMGVKESTVDRWRYRLGILPDISPQQQAFEERRARYKALFDKGLDNAAVAKKMRVSVRRAREQRKNLGYPAEKPTIRLDHKYIAARFDDDASVPDIAAEFGVSESTIRTHLEQARKMGLVKRPKEVHRPFTQEEIAKARELLEEGMSYAMAAEAIGRTDPTGLARHLPGMGWTPAQRMEYRWMRERLDRL